MSEAEVAAVVVEKKDEPREERIELFIDGQNFFYLQQNALKWFIDPSLLLEWLEDEFGDLSNLNYYQRVNSDGPNKEHNFMFALIHMGFRVKPDPSKTYFGHPDGKRGTLTPLLSTEVIGRMASYDHAIILSGDGDLVPVIEWLYANNKRFTVLGAHGFANTELRSLCGQNFVDLNESDIKARIQKQQE